MMLLEDASTLVLINGQSTPPFSIQCIVRQTCPLAPYLFFLIGKALYIAATVEQNINNIHGI